MTTKNPLPKAYPKELLTLGDHLRKRRLDLGLLQRELAARFHVDEMTINGWELGHYLPHVGQLPKIIEFLGYVPEDLFQARTTGEKIRLHRMLHGLTRRKLAKQLGIDEATLQRLEEDNPKRFASTARKVSAFLKSLD